MAAQKTVINKLVAEVYVASESEAFKTQSALSAFVKEKLLPIIERMLDRMGLDDEVIRIDKLELDLYNFEPGLANEDSLRKFEEMVEEKLLKLVSEGSTGKAKGSIQKLAVSRSNDELFLFLLKEGYLPWWAKTETTITLESLARQVLEKPSAFLRSGLVTLLGIRAVQKRIAFQLSQQSVENIIWLVSKEPATLLERVSFVLKIVAGQGLLVPENFRSFVFEQALKYHSVPVTMQALVSNLAGEQQLPPEVIALLVSIARQADEEPKKKEAEQQKEAEKQKEAAQQKEEQASKKNASHKEAGEETEQQKALKAFDPSNPAGVPEKEDLSGLFDAIETDSGHFVKNAGLVIIAPYLPNFFRELDLVSGNAFVSETARERAVYLLQYLVTGRAEAAEEHELFLNKILCGIDSAPLTLKFVITEKEKEESYNLLQAVTKNWPALKNTSPEGMRDAFFQRDGIMQRQSNGWDLKIERTTIDVLLDKLPWGISIVKLPWSPAMIFVDW